MLFVRVLCLLAIVAVASSLTVGDSFIAQLSLMDQIHSQIMSHFVPGQQMLQAMGDRARPNMENEQSKFPDKALRERSSKKPMKATDKKKGLSKKSLFAKIQKKEAVRGKNEVAGFFDDDGDADDGGDDILPDDDDWSNFFDDDSQDDDYNYFYYNYYYNYYYSDTENDDTSVSANDDTSANANDDATVAIIIRTPNSIHAFLRGAMLSQLISSDAKNALPCDHSNSVSSISSSTDSANIEQYHENQQQQTTTTATTSSTPLDYGLLGASFAGGSLLLMYFIWRYSNNKSQSSQNKETISYSPIVEQAVDMSAQTIPVQSSVA